MMNGIYLGKNYAGILELFDLYEVLPEDKRAVFEIISMIDSCRSKIINSKNKKPSK